VAANIWIAVTTEVITVLLERHAADERDDFEAMPTKIECVVDLRAKQAADVGAVGVLPPVVQFTTYCSAANVGVFFNNQYAQSRFGEKGGIGQPVMTCTYNNRIVVVHRPAIFRLMLGCCCTDVSAYK